MLQLLGDSVSRPHAGALPLDPSRPSKNERHNLMSFLLRVHTGLAVIFGMCWIFSTSATSSSDDNEYIQASRPKHILKPPKDDGTTAFETLWAQFQNTATPSVQISHTIQTWLWLHCLRICSWFIPSNAWSYSKSCASIMSGCFQNISSIQSMHRSQWTSIASQK